MCRPLALATGLVLLVCGARAEDPIPAETVGAVKRATAFIRVQGPDGKGTGSGFVVSVSKDRVLLATNYHVISGPNDPPRTLAELTAGAKRVTVTAVFNGGTKNELVVPAEVVATDPDNDLAVLRVTGLAAPPAPIDYANAPKPFETMTVYTFGYPFGQALALGKGAPAITVGKASVSSLRLDEDGGLARVQIDGALNPGNSGGPMVDAKGRLVGVAVSRIRDGQGIGFAVPAAELDRLMKGRLGALHLAARKADGDALVVKAEVGVIDPTAAFKGVTLHYVVVPPKGPKPKPGAPLSAHPGAKSVALKIDGGTATAEVTVTGAGGEIVVQAVPDGVPTGGTHVRTFPLVAPKGADAVALGFPGAAGAQIVGGGPRDTTFSEPVPDNGALVGLEFGTERFGPGTTVTAVRAVYRVNGEDAPGTWHGPEPANEKRVKLVAKPGYAVGAISVRSIILVRGASVTFMKIAGDKLDPKDSYESEWVGMSNGPAPTAIGGKGAPALGLAGKTSPRGLSGLGLVYRPGVAQALAPPARPGDRGPRLHGGVFEPEFRDAAPPKGHLVGLEVGVARSFNHDIVRAVRPVYRVGDKELTGEQFGTDLARVTRVVAKPGYAVGAITLRTTLALNSVQVTFMKIAGDKLDPKDSYDSELVGSDAGGPVRIGGDGTLVVGVLLKATVKDVTGLGLIYSDTNKPGLDAPWPRGFPSHLQGGGGDPEFREVGPEGSVLAGLEIGVGRFFDQPVLRCVRPVFRVGDKDTTGEWHGPTNKESVNEFVKIVARPGYAVGAMTVNTGLGANGLSVKFMKLEDGGLDRGDSYESEWVGCKGGGEGKMGDGTLVVGLIGRARGETLSGLGLYHSGPPVDRGPRLHGGVFEPEFRDAAPPKGHLVGLEVGVARSFNHDIVRAVRPVYRVGDKELTGEQFGTDLARVTRVVAKPGYAVGAVTLRTTLALNSVQVTFMKIRGGRLDPKDSYDSELVGADAGGPVRIGGDGTRIEGILLKATEKDVTGLGLIYSDTNKPGLDAPWPRGFPSRMQGGGGDPEFREVGPKDSVLVGMEVGVGRFFDQPVIKCVRPVFRVGDEDTAGDWHGPTDKTIVKEFVTTVAKPGYAVGAMTVRTGLGADGLSITFMKIANGKLDPKNSYESEWVGGKGGGEGKMGDGTLVIGLIGRARADTVSGLGLFHPPLKK